MNTLKGGSVNPGTVSGAVTLEIVNMYLRAGLMKWHTPEIDVNTGQRSGEVLLP